MFYLFTTNKLIPSFCLFTVTHAKRKQQQNNTISFSLFPTIAFYFNPHSTATPIPLPSHSPLKLRKTTICGHFIFRPEKKPKLTANPSGFQLQISHHWQQIQQLTYLGHGALRVKTFITYHTNSVPHSKHNIIPFHGFILFHFLLSLSISKLYSFNTKSLSSLSLFHFLLLFLLLCVYLLSLLHQHERSVQPPALIPPTPRICTQTNKQTIQNFG